MAKRKPSWTCKRQSKGKVCGARNPSRVRKCQTCGKWKPKRPIPKHKKILDRPYEDWAELYGETCNICGAVAVTRRLARDHSHKTGEARGLLCSFCNRNLKERLSAHWHRKAADYLERGLHL